MPCRPGPSNLTTQGSMDTDKGFSDSKISELPVTQQDVERANFKYERNPKQYWATFAMAIFFGWLNMVIVANGKESDALSRVVNCIFSQAKYFPLAHASLYFMLLLLEKGLLFEGNLYSKNFSWALLSIASLKSYRDYWKLSSVPRGTYRSIGLTKPERFMSLYHLFMGLFQLAVYFLLATKWRPYKRVPQ